MKFKHKMVFIFSAFAMSTMSPIFATSYVVGLSKFTFNKKIPTQAYLPVVNYEYKSLPFTSYVLVVKGLNRDFHPFESCVQATIAFPRLVMILGPFSLPMSLMYMNVATFSYIHYVLFFNH
jgi:hypothetical protein